MATYGSRDSTSFKAPKTYKLNGVDTKSNIDSKFYLLVDSVTSEITIKTADGKLPSSAGGNTSQDRIIGTIPKDGVFKPVLGSTTSNETQYFSSAEGQKSVKNHAVITAQKAGAQNAQQLIFPNTATPGAGQGQSTPTTNTLEETDKALKGTVTEGFGKNITYPVGLGATKQDIIKFTMLEYKPSGVGKVGQQGGQKTLGFGDARGSDADWRKDRTIAGSVILPIPSGISDTNVCTWGENSLNAVDAALAAAAFTGITEGLGKGIASLGISVEEATKDPNVKPAIGSAFAAGATDTNSAALLSRAEGSVINPNMELLFNGPQLRPFTFTFKLSSRSEKESKEIIKILNFFKRGMSAIKTESNLFLKAPNTFKIQYIHRPSGPDKDHPFIGRIKECALQSLTVNYTPEGQYATFTDGVMVSYEMNMQFTELEPIFNSDYDKIDGIGY